MIRSFLRRTALGSMAVSGAISCSTLSAQHLNPESFKPIGKVDSRYVSYNVEAVEVTGGRFWKPFEDQSRVDAKSTSATAADPYRYREPVNLADRKLRTLAAALSPAFVRVSGTWRNSVFFQDNDDKALATPPNGFKSVMTRAQWKGVIDFAQAVGADVMTSMSISDGTRDGSGSWTTEQAQSLFAYTRSIGGTISASEFMNEPNFAAVGAAPKNYSAERFGQDVHGFENFLRATSPKTMLLGPGTIGEGIPMVQGMPMPKTIASESLLKEAGSVFDGFSYHFYTTLSQRCVGKMGLSWEKVLTPAYLDRNVQSEEFYAHLRDSYLPGKPIWLTETGEAGCGGNRWASTFVDTFRFADQLGALAQRNVQAVIVNTLASSDYGLLDENSRQPRPDYWVAVLWKRLLGREVLDPGQSGSEDLRLYSGCQKNVRGGVTLIVLNIDRSAPHALAIPTSAKRYTLTATELLSPEIQLNDRMVALTKSGEIPLLKGKSTISGDISFPPASITFLTFEHANNEACRVLG